MAGGNNRLRGDQSSIKYCLSSVGQSSFELADFPREAYVPTLSDSTAKRRGKRSNSKTPEVMSTAELISAVGQIWDYASCPLVVSQNDAHHNDRGSKNKVIFSNVEGEQNDLTPTFERRSNYFCVDLKTASQSPFQIQPKSNFMTVNEKLSASEPFREKNGHTSFWKLLQGGAKMGKAPWRQQELASIEIACELENMYGWMKKRAFYGSKSPIKVTDIEDRTSERDTAISTARSCISEDATSTLCNLVSSTVDSNPSVVRYCNLSSLKEAKSEINIRSLLCSDYFLGSSFQADCSISQSIYSNLYSDYFMDPLVSQNGASEESDHSTDDNQQFDTAGKQSEELATEDLSKKDVFSSAFRKPHFLLAKQEHAFAGAFAGTFVSLSLHPVDTVKTVLQSCHAEQKSIFHIGRSIVAERGFTGLYRGISTNIASSAPISAIYTFTYESVKGSLLPHLPKEYHSFVHCVAGGCASIATSFVFTPSERIKQQMQVSSHYNNCWSALVGILKNGGFRSLYNGWGAVLCRNIPHSIIKFYTYESLKQWTLSSQPPNSRPNTLQTLVCGGLAGSTAAFFTTPFDVVKTRLQTQIPGATSQYRSVTHALLEIGKSEGLKGLYRGLTPRLVMYVSQGALFFASYEFFKKLFSLEMPQPEIGRIKYDEKKNDDWLIPLPSSQTSQVLTPSSAPTKLHNLRSSQLSSS